MQCREAIFVLCALRNDLAATLIFGLTFQQLLPFQKRRSGASSNNVAGFLHRSRDDVTHVVGCEDARTSLGNRPAAPMGTCLWNASAMKASFVVLVSERKQVISD